MKRNILIVILVAVIFCLSARENKAFSQEMVVIVHSENPVSSLRQIEAKLYFLRKIKQAWPGSGANIQPVTLKEDTGISSAFLSKVLKMSEQEVDAYFKQRQFANAETMPSSFQSENQVIEYVRENTGAIGYVSKEFFEASGEGVKVVLAF